MPSDTHVDEELRPIREYLEDVTGVSHGDSEVESAWLEQIEDFIVQRERAAKKEVLEQLKYYECDDCKRDSFKIKEEGCWDCQGILMDNIIKELAKLNQQDGGSDA